MLDTKVIEHLSRREREAVQALYDCMKSLARLPDREGAFRVECLQQARSALKAYNLC